MYTLQHGVTNYQRWLKQATSAKETTIVPITSPQGLDSVQFFKNLEPVHDENSDSIIRTFMHLS